MRITIADMDLPRNNRDLNRMLREKGLDTMKPYEVKKHVFSFHTTFIGASIAQVQQVTPMKTINAACFIFPSGEILWYNADHLPHEEVSDIIADWKKKHPDYADTPCTMAIATLTMPEDVFNLVVKGTP